MEFKIRRKRLIPNLMLAFPLAALFLLLSFKHKQIFDEILHSKNMSFLGFLTFCSFIILVMGAYLQFSYLVLIKVDDIGVMLVSRLKQKRIRWDQIKSICYQLINGTYYLTFDLGREKISLSDEDNFFFDVVTFWEFLCLLRQYKPVLNKDTGEIEGGDRESKKN